MPRQEQKEPLLEAKADDETLTDAIIPDDAIIMVDVDGTLLCQNENHRKNAALCELLRNRHINFLTSMGPGNLVGIQLQSLDPHSHRTLTRDELQRQMQEQYSIVTERIITPADAKYRVDDAGNPRPAGSAYIDFIAPHYPLLYTLFGNETQLINRDQSFVKSYRDFDRIEQGPGPACTKGNALRRYLEEHPGDRPVVFFDDSNEYLEDVYRTCTDLGRKVLCYKVDTSDANNSTTKLFWKQTLINNLNTYIDQRKTLGRNKRHWVNLGCFKIGAGYSKNTKINAAREMIKLLRGENSVLNDPTHEHYQTYRDALSQSNIRGDSALYTAIRNTQGMPRDMLARSSHNTVWNLIQHCDPEASNKLLLAELASISLA